MAVTFGLLAALLWGVTDFLIRVVGRGVGVHRSMLYAQGVGAVSVGLWLACNPAARRPLHDLLPTALAAAFGASPLGVLATLALYRGLQVGRVGLVSPIAGAYGAVTAALSLAGGETIGRPAVAGIAAVMVGGLLVSVPTRDASGVRDRGSPGDRAGALWAMAACIGYGVQFWVQGRFAAPQLGAVVPVVSGDIGQPSAGDSWHPSTLRLDLATLGRRLKSLRKEVGDRVDGSSCRWRPAPPMSPDTGGDLLRLQHARPRRGSRDPASGARTVIS